MGKFIKNIIFFLAFFSVVYVIYLLVAIFIPKAFFLSPNLKSSRGGYAHSYERFKELESNPNKEVLIIGSSHAYRGFDPRILFPNKSSFNLGNSAQSPYVTYHLLKRNLDIIQPKKVVFEAYWGPLSSSSSSVESSIDVVSNKTIGVDEIEMILDQKNVLSFNSMNYSFIKSFIAPLDSSDIQTFPHDTYISGGYVSKSSNEGYLKETNNLTFSEKKIEINEYQLDYLVKCIALCKEKGVEFIAVRAPVMNEYIQSFDNFNQTSKFMDSLFNSHDVPYQDFCQTNVIELMQLNSNQDFSDAHHLTQSGVEKFNRYWLENDETGLFK